MRTAFINELTRIAGEDERIFLLTADLGYSVLERFAEAHPAQYANVGVCEQAMTGIAAGMALSGKRVVTYSIANFPTLRCLEQVRNDICHHDANVTIVAVGGGLAYGAQGYTHHGVEDLGIMSLLPNMTVVCPADPSEVTALLPQLLDRPGPKYLRLGRSGEARLHPEGTRIDLGRANWIREGRDVAFLATGSIITLAVAAADALAVRGISSAIASFHTVRPLDEAAIRRAADTCRAVITVEEHMVDGGFGTRVADMLMRDARLPRFGKFGIRDETRAQIGSQRYLLERLGNLAEFAEQTLNRGDARARGIGRG
jgi:transketolase